MLLLDEPASYLDIRRLRAPEKLLAGYEGSVIFTSHDQRLVETVATKQALIAAGS